jgi:hypothetical protein
MWEKSEVLLGTLWGTCQELGKLFALIFVCEPKSHVRCQRTLALEDEQKFEK